MRIRTYLIIFSHIINSNNKMILCFKEHEYNEEMHNKAIKRMDRVENILDRYEAVYKTY